MSKKDQDINTTEITAAVPAMAENEAVYSASELAANAASIFGVPPDIANAAFTVDGKKEYTISTAKAVVKRFAERNVK